MVEIYNETISDLLISPGENRHRRLQIQKQGRDVCIPVSIHHPVYVHMHTWVRVRACARAYSVWLYVRCMSTCACMYVCTYVRTCMVCMGIIHVHCWCACVCRGYRLVYCTCSILSSVCCIFDWTLCRALPKWRCWPWLILKRWLPRETSTAV